MRIISDLLTLFKIANNLSSLLSHAIPAKRGKVHPADKLQEKAAKLLPLVGIARSKQDPINCGHGAQYLYCCPPAGANNLGSRRRRRTKSQ
jgi:hypothetical protein